jgi:hypothetical protein
MTLQRLTFSTMELAEAIHKGLGSRLYDARNSSMPRSTPGRCGTRLAGSFLRQFPEPAFHQIQPRGTGGESAVENADAWSATVTSIRAEGGLRSGVIRTLLRILTEPIPSDPTLLEFVATSGNRPRVSFSLCDQHQGEGMPAERLPMRKIKELLRLKFYCGLTDRQIGRSRGWAERRWEVPQAIRLSGAFLSVAGRSG